MVWLGDMTPMQNKGSSPAVSVVIPFRNAEATLADCLDSLQAQTFADFEALLIDDGSEDSSTAFVLERSLRDNRLRLISPGRIGLIPALNLGIAQSRADLIARMDADDIMSLRNVLNCSGISCSAARISQSQAARSSSFPTMQYATGTVNTSGGRTAAWTTRTLPAISTWSPCSPTLRS